MKVVVGLIASLLVGLACAAHPPPTAQRPSNLAFEVTSIELGNGMHAIHVRDPLATDVRVTMQYEVGAVDDPDGESGIAHLVEHLMFQQTSGERSLVAAHADEVSASYAFTSLEVTTFVSSAPPARLRMLLAIEATRLATRCASADEVTFERARAAVLDELHERAGDLQDIVREQIYPPGHPYRRSIVGTQASVSAISLARACAFANAHYAPNTGTVVIAGNLSVAEAKAALASFHPPLAPLAQTTTALPAMPTSARRVTVPALVAQPTLVVAWPLPDDPVVRVRMRAIAPAVRSMIDAQISGQVSSIELGDDRAPMIAFIIVPGYGESAHEVLEVFERLGPALGAELGDATRGIGFDGIRQAGLFALYDRMSRVDDRDARLATGALAGKDPRTMLSSAIHATSTMSGEEASLVAARFSLDHATIVELTPREASARPSRDTARATPHRDLDRRPAPEVALASSPLDEALPPEVEGATSRTLANGLRVVLLPLAAVPTVEIRMIFAAGTADEPDDERGVALAAGYALGWNHKYLQDRVRYVAAGGGNAVEVGTDSTAFVARGLATDLDVLLAGVRRRTREGSYVGVRGLDDAYRRAAKNGEDGGALTDAWRSAMFGARHPYTEAGLVRHASTTLGLDDAERFRSTHFTPGNATLVISGGFDAATAERWCEFLFADWTGPAPLRDSPTLAPHPRSIAKDEAVAQVELRMAFPATGSSRAHHLITAEILDEIARDVRRLGATSDLAAHLEERRLGASYVLAGWVDVARTREVVELVRDRLAQLRTDPPTTARAFLDARRRAFERLARAIDAPERGARIQADLEVGHPLFAERTTAVRIRSLTVDDLTVAIRDLDVARAAILLRGPTAAIDGAFAGLGRTPTRVRLGDTDDSVPGRPKAPAKHPIEADEEEEAITRPDPTYPIAVMLGGGFIYGEVLDHNGVTGYGISGQVGYRPDPHVAIGLHASIGQLAGNYDTYALGSEVRVHHLVDDLPVSLDAMLMGEYGRWWSVLFAGPHFDRVSDDGHFTGTRWYRGFGFGFQAGVDVASYRTHHLAAFARIQGELASDAGFGAFTLGLTYRR